MAHKANILTYFMMGALSWNFWHFGKQNIGVYAYYRLSNSTGGMLPVEKKLIYLGAVLGAMAVSFLGLHYFQALYSNDSPFDDWIHLSGYVNLFGKYLQYALASFTLFYILWNFARFDWKSALLFFLCVNYFLPAYLSLDSQRWVTFFTASFFTHGIQYVVFLFFHSYNARHTLPVPKNWFEHESVAKNFYAIVFVIIILAFYGSFPFVHSSIISLEFSSKTSEVYFGSLLDALAAGILLTHFWLDSFFWKFSNKESRDWMLERYNFLFKPAVKL